MSTYFMLATDEFGSVAVMPIHANNVDDAENDAREWLELRNYDHGFNRAILSHRDSRDIYAKTVTEIYNLVWNNGSSLLE